MKNTHEKFVEYGRNARHWMNRCKMLLLDLDRERVWEKQGFSSLYEYCAKLAGMSEGVVDRSLWVLRAIENKDLLMKLARERGLNAIRPVVTVLD